MFTRILLGVDDTKETQAAVEATIRMVSGGQDPPELRVLHVLEHGPGRAAAYDLESADDAEGVVNATRTALERTGARLTGEVLTCHAGDVGTTIAKAAAEMDCDLVVVGSRGLSDLGAAVLGSVAHDVIRRFDGCVLVAR